MRLFLVALISLFVCTNAMAKKVIDKAYMKCQYKYTYLRDTLKGEKRDDLLLLQIGHKASKCISYYSAQVDSVWALPDRYEIMRRDINHAFATGTDPMHKRMKTYVYKNYPEGKMTVTDGITLQDYIYEDSLDLQNWEIKDSVKSIMGYQAQMAECSFRGRHWTAWFAEGIPVNNGPWKLGNLPGLIMEAYDDGNQHYFLICGLQKVSDEPIIFSKTYVGSNKFIRTKRKPFLRQKMNYYRDMNGQIFLETGIDLGTDTKNVVRFDLLERDYK